MLEDRYGLEMSTNSTAAQAAYVDGVDCLLSANVGATDAFERAIAADGEFALAHAALARAHQVHVRPAAARGAIRRAEELSGALPRRERRHIEMIRCLIDGRSTDALEVARAHLADYPRDALVLAPCTSVFGLIGFSGRQGRERELVEMLDSLAGQYGDDWWFLCVHGFALTESGQLERARQPTVRALELNPRNANAAHFYAHYLYETGSDTDGLAFITEWLAAYPRVATLHCHLSWHVAVWLQEAGRIDEAWQIYRDDVMPGGSWGPPLNSLSDSASFLWRVVLTGDPVDRGEWRALADYAQAVFPKAGIPFADAHAAIAFAACGDAAALLRLDENLRMLARDGQFSAGPVVAALAAAWQAFVARDWERVLRCLGPAIAAHERIGGSRAQRDLIEFTWLVAAAEAGHLRDAASPVTRDRVQRVAASMLRRRRAREAV